MKSIAAAFVLTTGLALAGCSSGNLKVEGESNVYAPTKTLAEIHEEGLITDSQYDTLRKRLVDWFAGAGEDVCWRQADIINDRILSLGRRLRELRQVHERGAITEDEHKQIRQECVRTFRVGS